MATAAQRRASRNKRTAKRRLKQRAAPSNAAPRADRPKTPLPTRYLRAILPLSAGFKDSIIGDGGDLIKSQDTDYDAYFVRRTSGPALILQTTAGPIQPTPEAAEEIAADIRQIHGRAPDAAVPETVVMRVAPGDEASARIAMQHLVDTLNADKDINDNRPPLIAIERAADQTDAAVVAMVFTLQRRQLGAQGGPPPNQVLPLVAGGPAPVHANPAADLAPIAVMTSQQFAAATQLRGRRTAEYSQLARALDDYQRDVAAFRSDAEQFRRDTFVLGQSRQAVVDGLDAAQQRLATETARLLEHGDSAETSSEGNDGLNENNLARLQQAVVDRWAEVRDADQLLNDQIAESDALLGRHRGALDVSGTSALAAAQSYLDTKTLSVTNARQRATHDLIAQMADPLQHDRRLRAIAREVWGVDYSHALALATTKINTATASDVYRATTVGTIGDSGTRSGYAKRALVVGDMGNDTTSNVGNAAKGALITEPPNLIARQVVSSRIAKQLGLNVLADEVFSVDTDGRTLGITAAAQGRQVMEKLGPMTHVDPNDGEQRSRDASRFAHFDLTQPGVQKGLADLLIMDAITGQMDRHPGNLFIDDRAGTVTGIDNDMGLPRTGRADASTPTSLILFERKTKPPPPTLKFLARQVDEVTARSVLALTDNQLEATIRGRPGDPERLGDGEVELAKERLHAVQATIRELAAVPHPNGIISVWGLDTHAQAIRDGIQGEGTQFQKELNYLARADYYDGLAAGGTDPWTTQIP